MIIFLFELFVVILSISLISKWVLKRLKEDIHDEREDEVDSIIKDLDKEQEIVDNIKEVMDNKSYKDRDKNSKLINKFKKEK